MLKQKKKIYIKKPKTYVKQNSKNKKNIAQTPLKYTTLIYKQICHIQENI